MAEYSKDQSKVYGFSAGFLVLFLSDPNARFLWIDLGFLVVLNSEPSGGVAVKFCHALYVKAIFGSS